MPRTPRFILLIVLLIAAFGVLTSLAGIPLAFIAHRWYLLAFEAVVLVSCLSGVMLGAGRFPSGHALGMLSIGGVMVITGALSEPALVARFIQGGTSAAQPVAGVNIVPWLLARIGLGMALIALSGLIVLMRRPGLSLPLLIKGMLFGAPVLAVGVVFVSPSLRGRLTNLPDIAQVLLAIVGAAVIGTLITISGHCIIRAFEIGAIEETPPKPR